MLRLPFILLALIGTALANAQVASSDYMTFLLKYPSVRKDLGLSAGVTARILKEEQASEKRYFAMISPKPGTSQTSKPTMAEIQAEMKRRDSALLSSLSAAQKARLREIGIQYSGAYALGDLRISKELGLTPTQLRRLQNYATSNMAKMQSTMAATLSSKHAVGKGAPDPKENMAKLAAARVGMMRTFAKQAAAVLTPAQNKKWKAMQGRPFPVETLYVPAPARAMPIKR